MKNVNGVLILIGVIVLGYLGLITMRPSLRSMSPMEVLQVLLGDSKDSLHDEKFQSFKAPDLHYKISFPGTPSELNAFNGWLHPTVVPLPCYFMADRDVGFFVSEIAINNSDAPGRTEIVNIDRSLSGQAVGNNESVAASSQSGMIMAIQEFLDTQSQDMVKNAGATLFSKMPSASGGGRYPGRSIEGSAKAPGTRYRLQVFYDADNKRLFAISVSGKPDEIHRKQANQFLGSFQILP